MVAVCGQVHLDAEDGVVGGADPAAQLRQVFLNLATAPHAAGARLQDVVKLAVYLTDLARPRPTWTPSAGSATSIRTQTARRPDPWERPPRRAVPAATREHREQPRRPHTTYPRSSDSSLIPCRHGPTGPGSCPQPGATTGGFSGRPLQESANSPSTRAELNQTSPQAYKTSFLMA
ncbi:Rid family hydrolase [Streptomyces sp. NPDC003299]